MFIAYHLNKGYYSFTPRPEHIEQLLPMPNDTGYKVARLRQNYYYNSKTGKVSRGTKETGESFISFNGGETYIRLPWFIPNGSEDVYLKAIAANAEKMQAGQGEEETKRRIGEAYAAEVA